MTERFRPDLSSNFGQNVSETKESRNAAEMHELRERLEFVAKVISDNYDLKFIPGENWAAGLSEKFHKEKERNPNKPIENFDPKLLTPEILTFPTGDFVDRDDDYIFGVFRHEVGHVRRSDYISLIKAREQAEAEGLKWNDLFMIYDAWEDGRVNNLESIDSPRAKFRLGSYMKQDSVRLLESQAIENMSDPIKLSALSWVRGAGLILEPSDLDNLRNKVSDSEKVHVAYSKIESTLDEYLQEPNGPKAFEIFKKAWPVFAELIKADIEEKAKQKFEDQKEQEQKEEGGEQQQEPPNEAEGHQESEPKQQSDSQGNQANSGEEQSSWDNLDEDQKEQYRKGAREEIDREEKEIIKILQPKATPFIEDKNGDLKMQFDTANPEDIKKAKQEQQELEEQIANQQLQAEVDQSRRLMDKEEQLNTLDKRQSGLEKDQREIYDMYADPVKKYVDLLIKKIDEIFPPEEEGGWQGGQIRGKRVDRKNLAREIAIGRGRFLETKDIQEIKELAFGLLIDCSGSMAMGDKIEEALMAAIMMSEAFSKKGVPFEIMTFNRDYKVIKSFEEKYFGQKKNDLVGILNEVGGFDAAYNNDGYAVDRSAKSLNKRFLANNANGALIVISDGMPAPAPGSGYEQPEWELHGIVNKWSSQIPLIGVGIGEGMEKTIKDYYGKNGIGVPDVSKLPLELMRILEKQISKFKNK